MTTTQDYTLPGGRCHLSVQILSKPVADSEVPKVYLFVNIAYHDLKYLL